MLYLFHLPLRQLQSSNIIHLQVVDYNVFLAKSFRNFLPFFFNKIVKGICIIEFDSHLQLEKYRLKFWKLCLKKFNFNQKYIVSIEPNNFFFYTCFSFAETTKIFVVMILNSPFVCTKKIIKIHSYVFHSLLISNNLCRTVFRSPNCFSILDTRTTTQY